MKKTETTVNNESEAGSGKMEGNVAGAPPHPNLLPRGGEGTDVAPFDEDEELVAQCAEVIRSEGKASVSLIQRRLRLGYTRTCRIMDELERRGVVGPSKGIEPREILNLDEIQNPKSKIQNPKGETGTPLPAPLPIAPQRGEGEDKAGTPLPGPLPNVGLATIGSPIAHRGNGEDEAGQGGNGGTFNIQHSTLNSEGTAATGKALESGHGALDYPAAAAEQRRAAQAADLASIRDLEGRITAQRGTMYDSLVDILNALREQGEALRRIQGGDQLDFDFLIPLQHSFPPEWGDKKSQHAQFRISLSKLMPAPLTRWEEVPVDIRKRVINQLELITVPGLASAGPAAGISSGGVGAPRLDEFTEFLKHMTKYKQDWVRLMGQRKLEELEPDSLQSFVDDTEWIAQERARAMKLLKS